MRSRSRRAVPPLPARHRGAVPRLRLLQGACAVRQTSGGGARLSDAASRGSNGTSRLLRLGRREPARSELDPESVDRGRIVVSCHHPVQVRTLGIGPASSPVAMGSSAPIPAIPSGACLFGSVPMKTPGTGGDQSSGMPSEAVRTRATGVRAGLAVTSVKKDKSRRYRITSPRALALADLDVMGESPSGLWRAPAAWAGCYDRRRLPGPADTRGGFAMPRRKGRKSSKAGEALRPARRASRQQEIPVDHPREVAVG
jgi:hypothetical protein